MHAWLQVDPHAQLEHLGFIAGFLDESNPEDARTQLHENYQHGGGYRPQDGFKIADKETMEIRYPGDPPMTPLWMTTLRDERVYVYHYGYVLIQQPDDSFVIARMD